MRSVLLTVIFCACGVILQAQTTDFSISKVQKMQGLFVFCDSEPVAEYEYLGTIESDRKTVKWNQEPQYTVVRDALIKDVKEKFPEANGVILHLVYGSADKADAIKFK